MIITLQSAMLDRLWRSARYLLGVICLGFLLVLLVPALAAAAAVGGQFLLPAHQLWAAVIGLFVPLVTYVINHVGPWVSEPVKAAVTVLATAAASALYTALFTNVIGFNEATLELILTSIVAALGTHHWLWKPSGIAQMLGAGTNRHATTPVAPAQPGAPPAV